MTFGSTSVLEKAVYPVLSMNTDNSVLSPMSLVLFKLLALCWSLPWVFVSEWVFAQAPEEDAWVYSNHPSHLYGILTNFHTDIQGTPLPYTGALGWDFSLLMGDLHSPDISLLDCHLWVWDRPISYLCTSYQSWHGFFLSFKLLGFCSASLNSDGSVIYL